MSNNLMVVEKQLALHTDVMRELLPNTLPPERVQRSVMVALQNSDYLAKAEPVSIVNAAITGCVLGLEVDGVSGLGYLVPFKDRNKGALLAQFLTGYKGFINIAARSGWTIQGHVVRDGDAWEYDESSGVIVHRHAGGLEDNRSARRVIGAYAIARHLGFPQMVKVMGLSELLEIRERSSGWRTRREKSTWGTDFAAMCRKTPIRAIANDLPVLTMQQAAQLHTQHDLGRVANLDREGHMHVDGAESHQEPAGAAQAPEGGGEQGRTLEGELERPGDAPPPGPSEEWMIAWPGGGSGGPYDQPTFAQKQIRALALIKEPAKRQELWDLNRRTNAQLDEDLQTELAKAYRAVGVTT